MRQVYLDYSATTPVKDEVLNEMLPYFSQSFGNPSSVYSLGAKSKEALDLARERVAGLIGAKPENLYFTSSGTEADNWAIKGAAQLLKSKGNHIITTAFEHHAVSHTCEYLAKQGFEITYLPVYADGIVKPEDLEAAITDKTILITIMALNNEVGTIQPIKELTAIAKKHDILFHTDAVQALGSLPLDVNHLGVDMMSISSHKIYGPKGVGALYIRRGVGITGLMQGGPQEKKLRAGTENLSGIVGFGKAAELAGLNLEENIAKKRELRDYFIDKVLENIPHVQLNGSREHRHPGNANLAFNFIEGEGILILLDMNGISVSTGSACNSASLTPSHVLTAMGVPVENIHGSVRFTIGDFTTKEDLDYVIEKLIQIVTKLREISSVSDKKGW